MTMLLALVAPLLLAAAFVLSVRRDPRWTGNAFLLMGTILSILAAALTISDSGSSAPMLAGPLAHGAGPLALLALTAMLMAPLGGVLLTAFLLLNGVAMLRKEGRSLGNLLSFLTGLALLGTGLLGVVCIFAVPAVPMLLPLGLALVLTVMWVTFIAASYLLYTFAYPHLSPSTEHRYVIVHGSGLIGGRVPPLLRSRIDTGINLWRAATSRHNNPWLIMSGGQGPDEDRSEASAMAAYALERGVPQDALVLEDTSRTTRENLRRCRDMTQAAFPAGTFGLAVTSSYHVLRTAALAQDVGINVQVRPAPVASYFWPSAFLRELAALIKQHRVAHALTAAAVILPLPLAFVYALA